MSCILSDVSGQSVKSVSVAEEQVLPCPSSVEGDQGGLAGTSQNDRQGGLLFHGGRNLGTRY